MGRPACEDTPPELKQWCGDKRHRGLNAPARTAELHVVVTDRGSVWCCRLWDGDRCVAVGRAGVEDKDGRHLAVTRAWERVAPPSALPKPRRKKAAA